MAMKLKCDACGAEFGSFQGEVCHRFGTYGQDRYDLCNNCLKRIGTVALAEFERIRIGEHFAPLPWWKRIFA